MIDRIYIPNIKVTLEKNKNFITEIYINNVVMSKNEKNLIE
jgi:hypothetical protein